ncbi:hypothetical protein [Streptomyces mobaraensis]|uniref:hypothetical protein n=1 Tax=Streptomyces mobaraensis TaxID=35621 RepID=UPI0033C85B3E
MTDFKLEDEGAKQILRRLDEAAGRMREACDKLKKVGPTGLGTKGLDDACDYFQDHWHDGIKRIADGSKKMHSALKESFGEFQGYDRKLKEGFGT